MTPLPILFTGFVFALLGGLLALIAWDTETGELFMLAWGISALGGLALFVGLVSWSVEIGVRSARR